MILALDLSTPRGSLAVVGSDGEVEFSDSFRAHRSHNALLFSPLKEALNSCGGGGPSSVVVGTGPGSYTGVRVAIAAGIGIAMSFGIPVVGFPSVLAAGRGEDEFGSPFVIVGDARRGKFFGAEVDPSAGCGEFGVELFDSDGFRNWLGQRFEFPIWTFDESGPVSKARKTHPEASMLGRIAGDLGDVALLERAKEPLEPIYLSAAFVTMPKNLIAGGSRTSQISE